MFIRLLVSPNCRLKLLKMTWIESGIINPVIGNKQAMRHNWINQICEFQGEPVHELTAV